MKVTKERAAVQASGRGQDNRRTPAAYAILDATGAKVGCILGTSAGFMEQSRWEVCWLGVGGTCPRVVHYAENFRAAKAWAEQWDGQAPERWRA